LVNQASTKLRQSKNGFDPQQGLVLLTIAGIVFRSEVAVLLATHTLCLLYRRRLRLSQVVSSAVMGLSAGIVLTVTVDSFFWQRFPLWPELHAFIFNVVEGKSSEWGVSPAYEYFVVSLPKLQFNPVTFLIAMPIALATPILRRRSLDILVPAYAFVAILSIQPHKEWRFVVYALPPLTAVAASGADWIWKQRAKGSVAVQTTAFLLAVSIPLSIAAGLASLVISSVNYPGAVALHRLHGRPNIPQGHLNVHMDTLSCMTGVTRFLQMPETSPLGNTTWSYDKTDDAETLLNLEFWDRFDFVLAGNPEKAIGAWEIVDTITGYAGIVRVQTKEELASQLHAVQNTMPYISRASEDRWRTPGMVGPLFLDRWNTLGTWLQSITGGRWLTVRLEPKIHILQRTEGVL